MPNNKSQPKPETSAQQETGGDCVSRLVVPLPCPFCGAEPDKWVADPGAPYPGGYFEICCENDACAVRPCLSEKRRTDLVGMTHAEAEASIWPELIAKWNLRRPQHLLEAVAAAYDVPVAKDALQLEVVLIENMV